MTAQVEECIHTERERERALNSVPKVYRRTNVPISVARTVEAELLEWIPEQLDC